MATSTKTMFDSQIDLSIDTRAQMIELSNQQLADLFDLYSQTKQAHWNVKGIHFSALHKLFDDLAEGIFAYIDEVAERVTALGGYAFGTARMAADGSRLPEFPTDLRSGEEHVEALVERFAHFAKTTREAIQTADDAGDIDTSDLFTEISRTVDKYLWFLEAHLQG